MKTTAQRIALLALLATPFAAFAQTEKSNVTAKIYGFVRGDASVDSRHSVTAFEGLFLLYPYDVNYDANGKDLNKIASGGFYSFNSRLGVRVGGLNALNADISAVLEADFAGFSGSFGANYSVFRIRQGYMKMAWSRSALTVGHTWHPLFGGVIPDVISISVAAPFNPFNRSPLVRYDYQAGQFQLSAASIWQFQFASLGPAGKSNIYQRQALLPELYAGATWADQHFLAGAGINYLTIKPRTQATVGTNVYKVDESLGSLSFDVFAQYTSGLFWAGAKTVYGKNLSEQTMPGGYGISSIDATDGRQTYTNFTQSTTWVNVTYGKKYKGGVFAAYSKNLGSDSPLAEGSALYLDAAKIAYLYRLVGTFSYNIPHFLIGVEYEMTAAAYGDGALNYRTGRYASSHEVVNHRIVGAISYLF